jgi:hypothetical protein
MNLRQNKRIPIQLEEDELATVKRLAAQEDRSVANMAAVLVREALRVRREAPK